MSAKLYRNIPVADVPDDDDWVADQAIPDGVVDVYSLWPGRASVEITAVWWDEGADPPAAVYDATAVGLQPVEVKRVNADEALDGVPAFVAIAAATSTLSAPAFEKQSLGDTSPDELYIRVAAATAPGSATHLRLIVEVTS